MSIPKPKVPLKDHCSVIHDNVLYTYQPDAFQSLDLKEGGEWSQLSMGVATTGSACVLGTFDDKPALIIVGGSTGQDDYNGIQHYSFQDKKWTSDRPADGVATNRRRHGAAFLQDSSQIFTYGGSQDYDNSITSQTFLISTKKPYATQAYNSQAPPVKDPIVLQYNTSHALVAGGDPQNKKLFLFGADGWTQMKSSLRNGMQDKSVMQASILTGDDGSKVLEIFDMHDTPNSISTVTLQNATTSKRSYMPWKRDDRPGYNDTLASNDPRTGFSLASDPEKSLVVMSGGNDQQPVVMFDEAKNSWVDPNVFFNGVAASKPSAPPSSTPATTSPTFTPTAAPSVVSKQNTDNRDKSLTILGGTLGGVLGVAILVAILILCLKRQKKRKAIKRFEREEHQKKADMDFMDMGADFMREAGGSAAGSNHERNRSDVSHYDHKQHSRAASNNSRRALLHTKGESGDSKASYWSERSRSPAQAPPQISAPIITGPSLTRSLNSPRAENGWSAYFQEAPDPMPRRSNSSKHRPITYSSQASYEASNNHSSAEVEPLNLRPSQLYPPTGLGVALSHGQSRPVQPTQPSPNPSIVSDIEEESYHDSNGQASWSPVTSSHDATDRNTISTTSENRTSGNTNSFGYQHPGERIPIPNFPMPTSGRSSIANSPATPQGEQPPLPTWSDRREQEQGLRNVLSRDLMRTNSARQRATDVVRTGTQRVGDTGGGPTAGPFSRPQRRELEQRRQEGTGEDMSWLNLGTSTEPARGVYVPRGTR